MMGYVLICIMTDNSNVPEKIHILGKKPCLFFVLFFFFFNVSESRKYPGGRKATQK